jgi:hypothetical protein
MKNTFSTIMSILILVVLAAGVYFIVQTVRETAVSAAQPFEQVNQANQALQTQVAQLANPTPTIIPDPVTYINESALVVWRRSIQHCSLAAYNQDSPVALCVRKQGAGADPRRGDRGH